ncbi:TPA: class I SAM-dependent methyltransferase [Stenotrophomonas maltophilia]|uniref:class I SAM-dependent methyltransferase n=1 Tax=Stenotrophomonas maltophilia TaxID=40324 RepID=UPI0015E02CE1|nr:class I SAM-dependent methyltransferase [Stenotrophomonas maltophilia]MBA0446734.1 methyltransferase domain-containing protein [Stenotrophomonas maltophilia]HEL2978984.1 class I SAM-dependent methyltransferase [Stenotrophomonas maltophilia]
MSQKTDGLHAVLSHPAVYDLLQNMLGARRSRARLIRDHIRPRTGDRILDIGCGTGELFSQMPGGLHYVGFDLSEAYIQAARQRFGGRARFECMDVADYQLAGGEQQQADLVLAIGILHHLDDDRARALMRTARAALKPGGRFISLDGAYVEGQSAIAHALIARDRGQSIRTPDAYRALAEAEFSTVSGRVRGDMLYVPYTHYIMECVR